MDVSNAEALAELVATVDCNLEDQSIGPPPKYIIEPEVLRDFGLSNPAQLASQYASKRRVLGFEI